MAENYPGIVTFIKSMTPGSTRVYVVQLGYQHHCNCPAFANRQLGTWAGKERFPHCKHIDAALDDPEVEQLMLAWSGEPAPKTQFKAGTVVKDDLQSSWWKGWDARGKYDALPGDDD